MKAKGDYIDNEETRVSQMGISHGTLKIAFFVSNGNELNDS
jgi:hypothetical protein